MPEAISYPAGVDIYVKGTLYTSNFSPAAGSITDTSIEALAGVAASKLYHRFHEGYMQPNTTATSVTQAIYHARAAGTINAFSAGSIVACIGAATVTVDLKKNGTTCLSSVITLDSGNTAYVSEAGTLSVTSYAAGDIFTIVTVATAGGGTIATGFFCDAQFTEAAV